MTLILSLFWSAFVSILTGLISAALYDRWRRRDAVDDLRFSTLSDMIDPLVETALLAERWRGKWHDNPHHRDIHQYGLDAYSLGGFSAMQLLAEAAEARSHGKSVGGRIDKVWSGIGLNDRRGAWLA